MENFESQDEDFNTHISRGKALIAKIKSKPSASSKTDLKSADNEIQTLTLCLQQMKISLRECDNSAKKSLRERIKECEEELKNIKNDYKSASDAISREGLMEGRGEESEKNVSANNRSKLLDSNEKLLHSNAKLQETQRVLGETEEIAVNIVDNMHSQREVLLKSKEKADELKGHTSQASRLLRGMGRRSITNKLMAIVIIIILLALIGILIYFSFFR